MCNIKMFLNKKKKKASKSRRKDIFERLVKVKLQTPLHIPVNS